MVLRRFLVLVVRSRKLSVPSGLRSSSLRPMFDTRLTAAKGLGLSHFGGSASGGGYAAGGLITHLAAFAIRFLTGSVFRPSTTA